MSFRSTSFIFFGIAFLFCFSVQAEEIDPGKLLYENHCRACHTTQVHERGNRKVNSLVDLSKMVIRWQYDLKLDWSVDEVREVMSYLNQQYYQLNKTP